MRHAERMAQSSRLVELIDWFHRTNPGVSDAALARRTGVSKGRMSQWRDGIKNLPARANLDGLATAIGRPYREVLNAVLADIGYADAGDSAAPARTYRDVLDDAVRVLTEAARLTNQPGRQKPDGSWEPDPNAAPLAIDWAAFVTDALAGATANIGGIDAILAGRPGSWEADAIRGALTGAVGADEWNLWRHRTDPLDVVLHPERILIDMNAHTSWSSGFDAAEAELQRRENAIRPSYVYSHPGHELNDEMRRYYTDLGVQIIDRPPPPPPRLEELEAAFAVERDSHVDLSPEDQAEDDALAALSDLRDRLEALQHEELAEYGQHLAAAVQSRLEELALPVPVTVSVDLDTPWDLAPETPLNWATGAIDKAIAAAINEVATPDTLAGTPLDRAEAALARDQDAAADE